MNVMIAVKNDRFARMLALEFSERGFSVTVATAKNEMSEHRRSAQLALIDAAYLTESPLPVLPQDTVVLGYANELNQIASAELTKYYVVTRPFSVDKLFDDLFEADALKRTLSMPKKKSPTEFLALDEENRTIYFKGKQVSLTKKEFLLLDLLYRNRGNPVSRAQAMESVFNDTTDGTNVVDVYVNYLRAKIDRPFGIQLISTVRGKGYMIPSEENF